LKKLASPTEVEMRLRASVAAVFALLLRGGADGDEGCFVRGVSDAECASYAEGYLCPSNGRQITKEMVNDDYCDCPDRSDEPGTSACAESTFHCKNVGSFPKDVRSSVVNDGICDCCDGSDEWKGDRKKCENECIKEAKSTYFDLLERLANLKAALSSKGESVHKAEIILRGKKQELALLRETELPALLETKRSQEDRMHAAEVLKKAAEEKWFPIRDERNRIRQEKEEAERAREREQKDVDDAEQEEADMAELDQAAGTDPDAQAEDEHFPYPEEYRPKKDGEGEKDEEHFPYPEEYRPRKDGEEKPADASFVPPTEAPEEPKEEEPKEPETTAEETEYNSVRDSYNTAKREHDKTDRDVRDKEGKIQDLNDFLNMDMGDDNIFASLTDCLLLQVGKYTYSFCPFEKVEQKEGASATSMGKFDVLAKLDNGDYEMKFKDGKSCWQAPSRSCKVTITCGPSSEIVKVEEPSTCTYSMLVRSPVACDAKLASEIQAKIQQIQTQFPELTHQEL